MTRPDDPKKDAPKSGPPKKGKSPGKRARKKKTKAESPPDDGLNLAYLPPHARTYHTNADARIQDALTHVNPARAVSFLRKTHGPHAGQEALMRALLAERQHHRTAALYWLDVYEELVG